MKNSLKVHIPVILEYYYRFSFHCICNKMINKDKETGFYLCFNETKDLSHVVQCKEALLLKGNYINKLKRN